MNPLLLDLILRGTLVSGFVLLLDLALGQRQHPRWRRVWWVIVALAWILPLRLPRSAALPPVSWPSFLTVAPARLNATPAVTAISAVAPRQPLSELLLVLWLAGTVISVTLIVVRTARTSRRWSRARLCTEPELLNLLEDCKATAGVTAPIGLVVTSDVSTPALLGWLRPRILLPIDLIASIDREQLRGILFHELAHFRSADIPLQWLFSLAVSLHWFNPVAYLAARRWSHFRELAADANALEWLPPASQPAYGAALIAALRQAHPLPVPRGALALGESLEQLKNRITMIARSHPLPRLAWLVAFVGLSLSGFIVLPLSLFAEADPVGDSAKAGAQPAIDAWLKLIDQGDFVGSWSTASVLFKQAVTSAKWSSQCSEARKPLGRLIRRKLLSSLHQTELSGPGGEKMKGEFILVQYDGSFENLSDSRETVTFMKDPDGQWRAAGYYIKAR